MVKQRPQSKKQKRNKQANKPRNVVPIPRSVPADGVVTDYLAALTAPFTEAAMGSRIPDSYSFPTEVAHVTCSFTLSTNASGDADFSIQPHPLYSLINTCGSVSGGTANSIAGAALPAGITYNGATSLASLSSRFNDYRVVGVGMRLRFVQNFSTSQGKLYYAMAPAGQYAAGSLDTNITAPRFLDYLNIPYSTAGNTIPTTIQTLPYSGQMSLSELMEGGSLDIPLKITSADFSRFRSASNQTNSGPTFTTSGVTGYNSASDVDPGFVDQAGWSQIFVRIAGSAATSAIAEVTLIYHLEGTPNLADSTTLVGATSKSVVNVTGMWKTIERAAKSPFARLVAGAASNLLKSSPLGMKANAGMRALRVLGLGK